MLRIRGTAAIPEKEGFAAVSIGMDQRVRGSDHSRQARGHQPAVDLNAPFDIGTKNVVDHACLSVKAAMRMARSAAANGEEISSLCDRSRRTPDAGSLASVLRDDFNGLQADSLNRRGSNFSRMLAPFKGL
jgi:hypothetical protein